MIVLFCFALILTGYIFLIFNIYKLLVSKKSILTLIFTGFLLICIGLNIIFVSFILKEEYSYKIIIDEEPIRNFKFTYEDPDEISRIIPNYNSKSYAYGNKKYEGEGLFVFDDDKSNGHIYVQIVLYDNDDAAKSSYYEAFLLNKISVNDDMDYALSNTSKDKSHDIVFACLPYGDYYTFVWIRYRNYILFFAEHSNSRECRIHEMVSLLTSN